MKRNLILRLILGLAVVTAWCGVMTGTTLAADTTWADELLNMVKFEQATYPTNDFDPYLAQVDRIRRGLSRNDHQIVRAETDRFLKMLVGRAHGINDVAADELYNFTQSAWQAEIPLSANSLDIGVGTERLMRVPDHEINTPYEGGPKCQQGGCDYWIDNVFDPGAS